MLFCQPCRQQISSNQVRLPILQLGPTWSKDHVTRFSLSYREGKKECKHPRALLHQPYKTLAYTSPLCLPPDLFEGKQI